MNIIKPKNDTREYEYIELDNKMKIILIYDPDTLVSAAAMTVGVGFYEDYDKADETFQGIAHFLEHMLFMGTAKYPSVNYFMSFLNKSGGNTNAFTTGESTNYYFDVPNEFFEEGLDVFGQFFIGPLFKSETIEKEIDAINSEHSKNYNSDTWRIDRIVRELAFEDHPYHHFGCGTKKTLSKKNIREKLLEFHETYYSSNVMNLVIYSNILIKQIKKLVTNIFDLVTNKNVVIINNYNVFKKLPVTVNAIPIIDKNYLKIYIQIPQELDSNINNTYKYQSLQYIYNLLSHEAHGTLLYYLKKQDLSNNTIVVLDDTDRYVISIMLSIDLTDTGFNNLELIISMVYNYINLIKTQGITEWQYDEFRKIAQITFDYEPRISPSSYVMNICTNMLRYPISHVLIGHNYFTKFKPKVVETIDLMLTYLTHHNAIYIILSKKFNNNNDTNMIREKWFNIKYKIVETLSYNPNLAKHIKFLLPLPNKLLPKNIKLFQKGSLVAWDASYPRLVTDITNLRIYFKQDHTYNSPFVSANIILYNNEIYDTPRKYLAFLIYQSVIEKKLSKLSSYAAYVNTDFTINIENTGIYFDVSSYTSNVKYLLSKLINTFERLEVSEKSFITCKNNIKTDLQNSIYSPLINIATRYFREKISTKYFNTNTLIKVIDKIKLKEIEQIKEYCKNNCKVDCLIQGNYLEEMIEDIPELLKTFISPNLITHDVTDGILTLALPVNTLTRSINLIIPINTGQEEVYIRNNFNQGDNNSCIIIFFEIGGKKNEYVTNWDFKFSKLLILYEMLNEEFFYQLRSVEQSGYIVACQIKNIGTNLIPIWGFQFIIQSSNKSPSLLKTRIKKFIKKYEEEIKNMSEEVISKYKSASIHHLTKPCDNIFEETNKNMSKILSGLPFDYNKRIAKIIDLINKEKLIKFYNKHLIAKKTRRIRMLLVIGN